MAEPSINSFMIHTMNWFVL